MSRIYPDTNAFIYLFEATSPFHQAARRVFTGIQERGDLLVSSIFTYSELRVSPARDRNTAQLFTIERLFRSDQMILLPYTLGAVGIYATLRSEYRVKALDALHLACAAHAGVDQFITNDSALLRLEVPGIKTIVPLA